jgi:outer membrane protein assembly factor BamB
MKSLLCLAAFLLAFGRLAAADWPQYRGPNRDDVSTETGLLKAWPKSGPPLAWTYEDAGVGYSGVAIVGDRLYTIGGRGTEEYLVALDVQSGREVWSAKVGPLFQFKGNNWSAGPSSTPTVDGDRIYALGGMGDLLCFEANSGKEMWRKNLPQELDAQVNPIGGGPKGLGWGFTWSPLVDADALVCIPGGPKGTVAALDKKTGALLWRSADVKDQAAYTSPMVADIGGVRQYIVLTNQGLTGIAAADGKLLWRTNRKYSTEVINTPLLDGPLVYTTVAASGTGSDLVRIVKDGDAFKVEEVFSSKNLANHHGNVIRLREHVYGYAQGKGWTCQKLSDGSVVWQEKLKLGAGSMAYADGKFYCYSENDGTCVLIDASTEGWRESGRFAIPQQSTNRKPAGKIWTPPVVANGRLYLRDQELLFCFDVKAK